MTGHNEDSIDDKDKHGACSTGNDGQGQRHVLFAEDERYRKRTTRVAPAVGQKVCIECSKMVVDQGVWVTTKGDSGRAKVEVVRLDAQVALLNKCNDRL